MSRMKVPKRKAKMARKSPDKSAAAIFVANNATLGHEIAKKVRPVSQWRAANSWKWRIAPFESGIDSRKKLTQGSPEPHPAKATSLSIYQSPCELYPRRWA